MSTNQRTLNKRAEVRRINNLKAKEFDLIELLENTLEISTWMELERERSGIAHQIEVGENRLKDDSKKPIFRETYTPVNRVSNNKPKMRQ